MKRRIILVSGCMAVQDRIKGNIDKCELYPARMQLVAAQRGVDLELPIVTYKDLDLWASKVRDLLDEESADALVVQLRTYDILNLIVYGRTGVRSETFLHDGGPTSNWLSNAYRITKKALLGNDSLPTQVLFRCLRFINLRFIRNGMLFIRLCSGHEARALDRYASVVHEAERIALAAGIPLVFLGVTARPNSWLEHGVARRANAVISRVTTQLQRPYLDILAERDADGKSLLCGGTQPELMISLNSNGHSQVARRLVDVLVGLRVL